MAQDGSKRRPDHGLKSGMVYILECANGDFYIGSTDNLYRRFYEHENGKIGSFTKS